MHKTLSWLALRIAFENEDFVALSFCCRGGFSARCRESFRFVICNLLADAAKHLGPRPVRSRVRRETENRGFVPIATRHAVALLDRSTFAEYADLVATRTPYRLASCRMALAKSAETQRK